MNALATHLVHTDLGLSPGDERQTPEHFVVTSRWSVGRVVLALLFLLPALSLLSAARAGQPLLVGLAVVLCPLLLGVAALLGASTSTKDFHRARGFECSVRVLGYRFAQTHPWPTSGAVSLAYESRGSAKAGAGSTRRYRICVDRCPGAGFIVYRDYFAARAFAERLGTFLGLTVNDRVPPALQLGP